MAQPHRPSLLSFDSGRQSPFKRQNSASPAPTVRATTPTQTSPTKLTGSGSNNALPTVRAGSLSPEKTSPFVRRPSQINQTSERPASPFARPTSSLSIPASPSRQSSYASRYDETPPASPRATPAPEEPVEERRNIPTRPSPSPSPFDGPAADSPTTTLPSQATLRPTFQRTTTASSTTSTIKPPVFNPAPAPVASIYSKTITTKTTATNNFGAASNTAYKNVPQPLLRSMRESFEVLDTTNSGSISSAAIADMLSQLSLPSNPAALSEFFPPNFPSHLNLARYLDTLSSPLASLSPAGELEAAFAAFDVDDSGQIDMAELRQAVLGTAPEVGEEDYRMSEREVDGILGEFAGRRQFGAKGVNVAKGKGEVFRWREFMGAVNGGVGVEGQGGEGVVV